MFEIARGAIVRVGADLSKRVIQVEPSLPRAVGVRVAEGFRRLGGSLESALMFTASR